MSARKHVLVPMSFRAGDVEGLDRGQLGKFHHMTGAECRALAGAGAIEELGPKLWRLTGENCATAWASETGKGLLSREISGSLRSVMRAAMGARPLHHEQLS